MKTLTEIRPEQICVVCRLCGRTVHSSKGELVEDFISSINVSGWDISAGIGWLCFECNKKRRGGDE